MNSVFTSLFDPRLYEVFENKVTAARRQITVDLEARMFESILVVSKHIEQYTSALIELDELEPELNLCGFSGLI